MEDWVRIYDDEGLLLKDHTLRFEGPNGEYSITWTPGSKHYLSVHFGEETEHWHIMRKALRGADYKVSGSADWIPEILSDTAWYELIISNDTSSITY